MKNIIVITHERSGTHLVINIINNENNGLFRSVGKFENNVSNDRYNLKNYVLQANYDLFLTPCPEKVILKSHHPVQFFEDNIEELFENYHVIYVSRDVKDVLVSYYKFLKEGLLEFPKFEDWIFMKPCDVGYKYFEKLPDPHVYIEPKNYIERWKMHKEGWMKYKDRMFVLRYEDVLQNFDEIKINLENFLGKQIVIDKIPRLDDDRLPSFSFNKGIVGSHLEYMDSDLIKKIESYS